MNATNPVGGLPPGCIAFFADGTWEPFVRQVIGIPGTRHYSAGWTMERIPLALERTFGERAAGVVSFRMPSGRMIAVPYGEWTTDESMP